MKCHIIIAFIPLLLLVLQSSLSDAFSVSKHFTRSRTTTERLAWSLDIPENLGSFKSTWYNTVEYPTARRKVYDDAPNEFRFVTTGSDWPSTNEDETSIRADVPKEAFPRNPFRRAANWILRRRRQ